MGEGAGGISERNELQKYASYAQLKGLKACLYSGRDTNIEQWMTVFDYIKLGSYKFEKGPLTSPGTNQRMYKKEGQEFTDITCSFWETTT